MESIPIRKPAKLKKISEIRASDERVKVVGLVVNKGDSEFVLDDGSGQLVVILDEPEATQGITVGSRVRVFGNPMEAEGGLEFHADILHKVDGLDLQLQEQVREEWKRLEKELGRE
jgi:hypothetical protein